MERTDPPTTIHYVRRDLIANLLSSVWMPLLWIITVPQYILAMGPESFGLVGLSTTIQSIVVLLDLGLSITLNREFARLGMDERNRGTMRDTLRTMECIYWGTGALIGLILFAGADVIAEHWLRPKSLPIAAVTEAIRIMAGALALQWPLILYSGGLLGLHRQQTSLAAINIVFLTIRFVGVLPVLWFYSSSASVFFLYQGAIGFMHTLAAAAWLWLNVSEPGHRPSIRPRLLRPQLHFALGISGISFLELLLQQLDKVILSKLLSLEKFGYYSIATLIAMSLYRLFSPVCSSMYPRFTRYMEVGREGALRELYHRGCQLVTVLDFAVVAVVIFFPREVLFVWIGNDAGVSAVAPVLTLLVIGTAIRGLVFLPHTLQLAAGWTALSLKTGLGTLIVFVPCLVVLASLFGAEGAATALIFMNLGYTAVNIWLMHRRLLRGELRNWLVTDVGLPLIGPLTVTAIARLLLPVDLSRPAWAAALCCVCLLNLSTSVVGAPLVRALVSEKLHTGSKHD